MSTSLSSGCGNAFCGEKLDGGAQAGVCGVCGTGSLKRNGTLLCWLNVGHVGVLGVPENTGVEGFTSVMVPAAKMSNALSTWTHEEAKRFWMGA